MFFEVSGVRGEKQEIAHKMPNYFQGKQAVYPAKNGIICAVAQGVCGCRDLYPVLELNYED